MAAKVACFDRVAESRREPNRAHHAQLVLAKAIFGMPDRANDSGSQIIAPAHKIENFVGFGIEQQRVDREIAALHVFLRRFRVNDAIRMPPVGVADIGAKRGDFDLQANRRQPNVSATTITPNCAPTARLCGKSCWTRSGVASVATS